MHPLTSLLRGILQLVRPTPSSLVTTLALRIQERFLSHGHATPAHPRTDYEMVACCGVECATVVPDSCQLVSPIANTRRPPRPRQLIPKLTKVTSVLPVKSDLQVLIVKNKAGYLVGDLCCLLVRYIIDRQTVGPPAEHALPARQRMGSD